MTRRRVLSNIFFTVENTVVWPQGSLNTKECGWISGDPFMSTQTTPNTRQAKMGPEETWRNRLLYDAVPVRTYSFQMTSFPVWPHQHTVLHFLRRWGGHLRACSISVSKVDQKMGRVSRSGGNIDRRQHSAKGDTGGKVLGSCPGHDQEDFKGKNA